VNRLTTFVRSLGNDGARRNATTAVEASMREEWLVQGLARRLEQSAAVSATTALPTTAAAA
jgi:hypothetical protein